MVYIGLYNVDCNNYLHMIDIFCCLHFVHNDNCNHEDYMDMDHNHDNYNHNIGVLIVQLVCVLVERVLVERLLVERECEVNVR